jgi:hypothetical protein
MLRVLYWGGLALWTAALMVVLVRVRFLGWKPPGGMQRLLRGFVLSFYAILLIMVLALLLRIRLF